MERWLSLQGMRYPRIMYGTAWKEDATSTLVQTALSVGFRAIDTANQRKHYHEAHVGEALQRAYATGLRREDVFLQTKFTYVSSQDHRLPYDPSAPFADQVAQSFASSLEHLGLGGGGGLGKLDALVLHGPSQRAGLGAADGEVWAAMEELHEAGQVCLLGVSNITRPQLEELCRTARVPPAFVHNRCYASKGWDADVRSFCAERGMAYQGFSLLTANRDVWGHVVVAELARKYGRAPAQVIFRSVLQAGICVLTGTTDRTHMVADLEIFDFELSAADAQRVMELGR